MCLLIITLSVHSCIKINKNENITDNSVYMYSTWNLADQVSFGCSFCHHGTNEPASSRRPSAVSVILRCYETVRQTATRKHFCLDQGLADHVTTTNEQKSKLHKNGRTHIGKNSTITFNLDQWPGLSIFSEPPAWYVCTCIYTKKSRSKISC